MKNTEDCIQKAETNFHLRDGTSIQDCVKENSNLRQFQDCHYQPTLHVHETDKHVLKTPSRSHASLFCLKDKLFSGGANDFICPFQPDTLISTNRILNSKISFQSTTEIEIFRENFLKGVTLIENILLIIILKIYKANQENKIHKF